MKQLNNKREMGLCHVVRVVWVNVHTYIRALPQDTRPTGRPLLSYGIHSTLRNRHKSYNCIISFYYIRGVSVVTATRRIETTMLEVRQLNKTIFQLFHRPFFTLYHISITASSVLFLYFIFFLTLDYSLLTVN